MLQKIGIFSFLALFLFACGTPQPQKKKDTTPKQTLETAKSPTVARAGEMVKKYDLNGDKTPDLWKVYVKAKDPKNPGKSLKQLVRIEIDLNGDNKIDIRRYYTKIQQKTKEMFDLDFDGYFDVINYYHEGLLSKQEYFLRSKSAKPNLFKYYEPIPGRKNKGKVRLTRKERDTNNDGKIDYWEYWEKGTLDRIGRDTDFDGNVDVWEKRAGSE